MDRGRYTTFDTNVVTKIDLSIPLRCNNSWPDCMVELNKDIISDGHIVYDCKDHNRSIMKCRKNMKDSPSVFSKNLKDLSVDKSEDGLRMICKSCSNRSDMS